MKKTTNKSKQTTKVKKKKVKTKKARLPNNDKRTTTNKNMFLNALIRNNFHITNTCNQTGIPRMTFYQWQRTDKKFAKKMDDLRELEIDTFEDAFRDLVEERNPQAVIFGLKTRGKNRGYVERTEVEHTGITGINILFGEPVTCEKIIKQEDKKQITSKK